MNTMFLIPLMMFFGRGAGANWWGLKQVFGALFALTLGVCAYHVYGHWAFGLVGFLIAWGGYETGHGTFYRMTGFKKSVENGKTRMEYIDYLAQPVFKWLGMDILHPSYSWFCMGVKGFVIGLPLGFLCLPLAFLYPAGYWYGMRIENSGAVAELVTAMFVGMCAGVVLFLC